jgi:hypothetical protein
LFSSGVEIVTPNPKTSGNGKPRSEPEVLSASPIGR